MSPELTGRHVPDPRDRNLSSRRRSLVAGLTALLHTPDAVVTDGLHRKRIAAVSGQSRQTLYQYFPDHDAYVAELLHTILDPADEAWPLDDPVRYMRDLVEGTPSDSLAIVHRLAEEYFTDTVDNEHWALTMTAWVVGRHRSEVRADLARNWAFYTARTAVALGALLDHWDAELAPPFDLERAAVVFSALAEGLAVRSVATTAADASLFADTIAAIAHAVVIPRDASGRQFEPQLPETNPEPVVPLDPATVEGVLHATVRCYERSDVPPTLATIAREAHVAEASINAHFGGTAGLLVALWDRFAADLARTYRGLDPRLPILGRLRLQLRSVVELAASCPALTAHFLVVVTTPPAGNQPRLSEQAHLALASPFEDMVRSARQGGHLDFALPPRVLAQHLVSTALGNAASAPRPDRTRRADVDAITERVWLLVLHGCRIADAHLDEPDLR